MNTDLNNQAADVHAYLVEKIGHKWRLSTWKKQYLIRLKKYSFEQCIIAIDGFRSMQWWMDHKSQDAPDCIFRSDKSFERFLAAGATLPEHRQDTARVSNEREERLKSIRTRLEAENAVHTARMKKKLEILRTDINENSWMTFIDPLLFITYQNGSIILFSEESSWVQNHYADKIAGALNAPVVVVDDIP